MSELKKVAVLILMYSAIAVSSQVIFDDEPEQPNRQSDRNGNVVVIKLEQQPSGFHRPTQQQQRPNNGFGFQQQNPNNNGFQQKPNNNGFQQNPNNGFQQNPNNGFQQNPNNGFQQNPNNGFQQNPNNGFQQNPNNNGFQQNPNNGFQGQGQQGFFPQRPGNNNFQNQDQSGFQNQNEINVASRSPDCRTYENTGGFCTPLNACGRIARLVQNNRSPFVAARILRRSICGFSGIMPSVCCPTGRGGQQQQPTQQRPISSNNNNFGNGDFKNNNNNVNNPGFGGENGKGNNNNNGPGLVIINPTPPTTTTTTTTTPFPIQMVTEPVKKPVGNNPGGLIIGDGPIALLPPQRGGGSSSESLGYSDEGLPKDCGYSNASHTRIVGGKISEKGAWPWIAALGYKDTAGNVNYLCGGALFAPSYVVTASHCLHGRNDLSSVRLGDHDIFSTSDNVQPLEVQVDKIIMHPKYDPNTFKNDIALLRLKTPVPYTRQIHPICLPSTAQLRNQRFENTSPFVAGWGAIQFNGPSSSVLREVQVPTVPDSVCKEKYSSFKTAVVDDTNICAGLQTGGKDACQGDSGGPLQQPVGTNRYILIGVVSFGFKCAEPGFPGIYTRVTNHLDWLQNAIGQSNK